MTKTTAPRVRQTNLYTVEQDGMPVAQAEAISQAEAVRLYVESVQQPAMTARLSSPMEARMLAHLPLLSRAAGPAVSPAACTSPADLQPERDPRVPDMFEDVPAAPVSPVVGAVVDAEWSAADAGSVVRRADGVTIIPLKERDADDELAPSGDPVTVLDGGPASALPAEFVSYIDGQGPAAEHPGEPQPSAPSTAAPTGIPAPAAAEADETPKPELKQQAEAAAQRRTHGGKPVALYRNPADGASWSGRGLKPRWLVEELEAGRTQDEFLIEKQGEQA